MPFTLSTELGGPYWTHNSGGEHAVKHYSDIGDINEVRVASEREPFDEDVLYDYMSNDGVVTIRENNGEDGVGGVVGYIVAERTPVRIDVKDLTVLPDHRSRGLGGLLLGKLITGVPMHVRSGIIVADYGRELSIDNGSYLLPGVRLEANEGSLGSDDAIEKFIDSMPPGWNGIRSITYQSGASSDEIVKDGLVVGGIDRFNNGLFGLSGSAKRYDHPIFPAIDLLTRIV